MACGSTTVSTGGSPAARAVEADQPVAGSPSTAAGEAQPAPAPDSSLAATWAPPAGVAQSRCSETFCAPRPVAGTSMGPTSARSQPAGPAACSVPLVPAARPGKRERPGGSVGAPGAGRVVPVQVTVPPARGRAGAAAPGE